MRFFRCNLTCLVSEDLVFFFKQKTAYEMRISDWSSDVCSSDLVALFVYGEWGWGILGILITIVASVTIFFNENMLIAQFYLRKENMTKAEIGRASCRERVCQYV